MSTNSSSELVVLDQADHMLEAAKTIDEVKMIRDKAEAARTYIKAAQLGLEMQNQAAEIKLRAERKAGRFLTKLALRGGDRRSKSHAATLKLEELGISRDQSSRWQNVAAVPEKEFQKYLKSVWAERKEVTSAGLLRLAAMLRREKGDTARARILRVPRFRAQPDDSNESTFTEELAELSNHRDLLAQILKPMWENGESTFRLSEQRMVARLLREMGELLQQLREKALQTGRD